MTDKNIFDTVWAAAKQADFYHKNRTVQSIYNHALSEMGEIALEINIADGQSYKLPGSDGIVGETIDAIAAMLDLIYKVKPDFPKQDYVEATNKNRDTYSKSMFSTPRIEVKTIHALFNVAQAKMGKVASEINTYNEFQNPEKLITAALESVVSMLDIIYKVNSDFTEQELVEMLNPKMKKWIEKIAEHSNEFK